MNTCKVEVVAVVDWDIPAARKVLGLKEYRLDAMLRDGRFASQMVSAWLDSNITKRVSDGTSGWLHYIDGVKFRLRIATDTLSLAPSGTKGMGRKFSDRAMDIELDKSGNFLVVFTSDMNTPPVFWIHNEFIGELRSGGLLNSKFEGNSHDIRQKIRDYLRTNT